MILIDNLDEEQLKKLNLSDQDLAQLGLSQTLFSQNQQFSQQPGQNQLS